VDRRSSIERGVVALVIMDQVLEPEASGPGHPAELCERLHLDLADPLPGDSVDLTDLRERVYPATVNHLEAAKIAALEGLLPPSRPGCEKQMVLAAYPGAAIADAVAAGAGDRLLRPEIASAVLRAAGAGDRLGETLAPCPRALEIAPIAVQGILDSPEGLCPRDGRRHPEASVAILELV